jgi:hypothetical protein
MSSLTFEIWNVKQRSTLDHRRAVKWHMAMAEKLDGHVLHCHRGKPVSDNFRPCRPRSWRLILITLIIPQKGETKAQARVFACACYSEVTNITSQSFSFLIRSFAETDLPLMREVPRSILDGRVNPIHDSEFL